MDLFDWLSEAWDWFCSRTWTKWSLAGLVLALIAIGVAVAVRH